MFREKAFHKKFKNVGPGGLKCGCCFPQTNPGRHNELKLAKRRFRLWLKQEVVC